MQEYTTIYDYTAETKGIAFDKRIMSIADAIGKRFNTVIRNLYRANFSQLEKKAIIKLIKDAGNTIPNELSFFEKKEGVIVSKKTV